MSGLRRRDFLALVGSAGASVRRGCSRATAVPWAAAAIPLLLFTGCRLRKILHLKWEQMDTERGLLFLGDSKTGTKTVILNAPALAVLTGFDRLSSYVVPGDNTEKPRADLKRPWEAVAKPPVRGFNLS